VRTTLLALLGFLVACAPESPREPAPESAEVSTVKSEDINATLDRHAEELMAHEGIQGIYVGLTDEGQPCLVILATVPAEDLAGVVPDSLEGWPVRIESGDEIRPMN